MKTIRLRWLFLIALPVGIFLHYGPLMAFRIRERGNIGNLNQLGKAVALYMADHEGQYPVITGDDFAVSNLNGQRVYLSTPRSNPLAPYLKDPAYAYDPAFHFPYDLRFVQSLPQYNPRDPMVAGKLIYRREPNPRNVLAVASYVSDLRVSWSSITIGLPQNQLVKGYYYALRGDGSVGKIPASSTRVITYDGKMATWSDPQPNIYRTRWGREPIYDWTLFPGESWPEKTTLVGTYVPTIPSS